MGIRQRKRETIERLAVLGVVQDVFSPLWREASSLPGRTVLMAVDADEPAGKPVKDCLKRMVSLHVHRGQEDDRVLQRGGPRDFLRRRGLAAPKPSDVWRDKLNRRFTSFVISADELLATFHPDDKPQQSQLVRLDIRSGDDREVHSLPADAVKGGTAVDASGHVFITLENGQLMCFQGKRP